MALEQLDINIGKKSNISLTLQRRRATKSMKFRSSVVWGFKGHLQSKGKLIA